MTRLSETDAATHCRACGEAFPPVPPGGGAAGYARFAGGERYCYRCTDAAERRALADAEPGDRDVLYLRVDPPGVLAPLRCQAAAGFRNAHLTTWTGGPMIRGRAWCTGAGFGGVRWYFRGVGPGGTRWAANSPGPGMYARARCVRS